MTRQTIAVAGASGFIGRQLVPRLRDQGDHVRALTRRPASLVLPGVETRYADVLDARSLPMALEDADTAYYLVHSMEDRPGGSFAERDRRAADHFVQAAEQADVSRIIYLGGLGETGGGLSEHLASRAEVGRILQSGTPSTTVLRAAIILGPGGASWDMLRQLVERLPMMVTPRWVETRCQPIALRDVLGYLIGCADAYETVGKSFDIGGPDILTYRQMMTILAEVLGKRRWIVDAPVLTPRLSSYWVDLVTTVPASVAHPLVEGLKNEVVCRENRIRNIIPQPLTPYREAISLALQGIV